MESIIAEALVITDPDGQARLTAKEIEEQAKRRAGQRTSIMLHAGGYPVQADDLRGFPAPRGIFSQKYEPYEHYLLVEDVEHQIRTVFGRDVVFAREFALKDTGYTMYDLVEQPDGSTVRNKRDRIPIPGGQFFGLLKLDLGFQWEGDLQVPVMALRNSYDGSMTAGVALGNSVFICDNYAFSGEHAFTQRHTKSTAMNLFATVRRILERLPLRLKMDQQFRELSKSRPVDLDEGYAVLGQLYGRKLLNAVQMSVAMTELRKPSFREFEEPNAWSLFNHITFAKKRTTLKDIVEDLEGVDAFFRSKVIAADWRVIEAKASHELDEERRAKSAAYVGPLVAPTEEINRGEVFVENPVPVAVGGIDDDLGEVDEHFGPWYEE